MTYLEPSAGGSRLRVLLGLANSELTSLAAFASFASGLRKVKKMVKSCTIEFQLRNDGGPSPLSISNRSNACVDHFWSQGRQPLEVDENSSSVRAGDDLPSFFLSYFKIDNWEPLK